MVLRALLVVHLQKVSVALTVILSVSAYASWRLWLEHQEKLAAINADVRLKHVENERLQLLLRSDRESRQDRVDHQAAHRQQQ